LVRVISFGNPRMTHSKEPISMWCFARNCVKALVLVGRTLPSRHARVPSR
jgi:hypothetical protein